MRNKNRVIKSRYIYKLRKKDDERFFRTGTKLPNKPSVFDECSEFNQAIRNNKK